jgi:hypothetical protein
MRSALRPALLIVACLVIPAVLVAGTRGPALTIRGTALLSAGDPVYKAHVTATAGRRNVTATDDRGRFTLDLPLPDPASLGKDSTTIQIWIAARSLHFTMPDGQWSLGLVLKLEHDADGASRVVARSNDARLAECAARAIASRSHVEIDSIRFTGQLGEASYDPYPPRCLERAEAPLAEAGAAGGTKPAHPSSDAGAAVTAGVAAGSAAGHGSPPSASSAPLSAPAPAYVADSLRYQRTPEDTMCSCRIAGTVEAGGGPLRAPLRIVVSLEGLGAPRDTVTLDMGSPRAFDLRDVPCGPRRLVMRPLGGKPHFTVVDPNHSLRLDCERDRRAQPQVVVLLR